MNEIEPVKPDEGGEGLSFTERAHMAFVTRDGRARLEIVGPHPHPMLVPCSERAWKDGKRGRLCGCPECHAAFDRSL